MRMMDIYAFPSKKNVNIWAAIGRGVWAVSRSKHDSVNKGRLTKAAKMPIGSFGLIYCSDTQAYSTPFVVLSQPKAGEEITDVWPEPWVLPFAIRPLGNPTRFIARIDMPSVLPTLKQNPNLTVDDLLEVRGVQAFNASTISEQDWAEIFQRLVI